MTAHFSRSVLVSVAALLALSAIPAIRAQQDPAARDPREAKEEKAMLVQYLEIVTPDVDATCEALAELHGASFGKPVPELGKARTATLAGGGKIGVRAPLRADEKPVVRPYLLVEDIEAAVESARSAGAQIAHPPLKIPGQGTFAIYLQGGIEHGLWQL